MYREVVFRKLIAARPDLLTSQTQQRSLHRDQSRADLSTKHSHAQIDIGIYFVPTNEGAVLETRIRAGQKGG